MGVPLQGLLFFLSDRNVLMFFLPCPVLHVLMKENGKRSLWFPGVAFRSLSIHQERNRWKLSKEAAKPCRKKNPHFLSRGKSTPKNDLWVWGEREMVMELGWNWIFRVPSSAKQPMVLGEQVCAEGTWLCCTGDLGRWGRTSALVEQEDLKVREWKIEWHEHHQSQE